MGKAADQRKTNDFFPTPAAICAAALWECVTGFTPKRILDPGAGSGAWGTAARQRYGEAVRIYGVEYRDVPMPPAYNVWVGNDFLDKSVSTATLAGAFDMVIGNPPYGIDTQGRPDKNLVEKFVRKSFQLVHDGGFIVFLLRMNFLGGGHRMRHFWCEFPAKSLHVLGDRPSFTGDGKTEANGNYAVFTFQKGFDGDTTQRWLNWRVYDQAYSENKVPSKRAPRSSRRVKTQPAQQPLIP